MQSSVVPKSEEEEEEEEEERAAGNAPRTDSQQLRQLLVANTNNQTELVKLQSADSGIDTQSNASDTPACGSLPTHPQLQSPIEISANPWSHSGPVKPTPTAYTSVYSSVSVRSPALDVATTIPVSFAPAQQPQVVPTYVLNEQPVGLMAACPPTMEQSSCFVPPQNEMNEFYNGYRSSLQPGQLYDPGQLPRQESPYMHAVAFTPSHSHYDPNAVPGAQQVYMTPSPSVQPLPYDIPCGPTAPYTTHLQQQAIAGQPVYTDVRQEHFLTRLEPEERLGQLPSISTVSQPDMERRLASPYQPNGQPMVLQEQGEGWVTPAHAPPMRAAVPPPRVPSLSGNPNGQIQLWSFILDELENHESQDMLCWTGDGWEFRFKDPEKVAKKWGEQKNKPSMNYEKMSRGLRYYYDKDIIRKSSTGGRYHYRFTEKKMAERTPYSPAEYFRNLGITPQKEDPGK